MSRSSQIKRYDRLLIYVIMINQQHPTCYLNVNGKGIKRHDRLLILSYY